MRTQKKSCDLKNSITLPGDEIFCKDLFRDFSCKLIQNLFRNSTDNFSKKFRILSGILLGFPKNFYPNHAQKSSRDFCCSSLLLILMFLVQ